LLRLHRAIVSTPIPAPNALNGYLVSLVPVEGDKVPDTAGTPFRVIAVIGCIPPENRCIILRNHRRGITLIELLVVIAILIALKKNRQKEWGY
jgi:hypothetical protein